MPSRCVNREVSPTPANPSPGSSMVPSDREQAALEKTNIYSFQQELAQAVSCNWHLSRPMGWTPRGSLEEIGRCPRGHQHPDRGRASETGPEHAPTRHVALRLHTFAGACSPPPPGALLASPVRKFILLLALCSLLLAPGLTPGASEDVSRITPWGDGGPG